MESANYFTFSIKAPPNVLLEEIEAFCKIHNTRVDVVREEEDSINLRTRSYKLSYLQYSFGKGQSDNWSIRRGENQHYSLFIEATK